MAEFEVNCPHCGVELIVPEEWAGMDGECPSCKKSFTIALKSRKLPDPRKQSSGNCNLIIDNYETEKRIDVIAAIRELKNTELSEPLNLIDNLPATLLENVSAEQAEEAKRKLEEIGAYVHLENRKSSAPRAEKKKNTAPRPSVKQQIRHNNQKKKARPVQSADSSESSSKGDDDDSSNGFNDILSGLCFGGGLAVILFLVEACSGKGSIIPPLLFWIIIPVFWLIYIACGGLKLKSFSKNLIGGTIAFIMTSMLMNPESAIRSLLHSISSSDNRKTTVASADKSSVSTPKSNFTIKNQIRPKPEKCVIMIFPMAQKDKVKEWYSIVKKIYPEYVARRYEEKQAAMWEIDDDRDSKIQRMKHQGKIFEHAHNISLYTIKALKAIEDAERECLYNKSFRDKLNYFECYNRDEVSDFKEPIVLFAYALVPYGDLTIIRAWYLEYSPGKAVTLTLN